MSGGVTPRFTEDDGTIVENGGGGGGDKGAMAME